MLQEPEFLGACKRGWVNDVQTIKSFFSNSSKDFLLEIDPSLQLMKYLKSCLPQGTLLYVTISLIFILFIEIGFLY